MKILALDASSSITSIAFLDHDTTLFEYHQPQERTNSSTFFQGLETALHQCGKPDRLVVGLGPGSYNGIRVSIAAAQGIAASRKIDLVGLPSVLGFQPTHKSDFLAIGDARGGQYWFSALSAEQKLLQDPLLLSLSELLERLEKEPHLPILSSQLLPQLPSSLSVTITSPNAVILAKLGEHATVRTCLEPLYLKQAHITLPRTA